MSPPREDSSQPLAYRDCRGVCTLYGKASPPCNARLTLLWTAVRPANGQWFTRFVLPSGLRPTASHLRHGRRTASELARAAGRCPPRWLVASISINGSCGRVFSPAAVRSLEQGMRRYRLFAVTLALIAGGLGCAASSPSAASSRLTTASQAQAPKPRKATAVLREERITSRPIESQDKRSSRPKPIPGDPPSEELQSVASLPSWCATPGDLCLPPPPFADELCRGKYPDVAVYMMQKSQPWTRGYVRVQDTDTINTLGGPTGEAKLVFGEEVLILRAQSKSREGIQISGMDGFIVLRWDGTCATLAQHELVTWVPGLPRHAPLVWKYLGDGVQNALLKTQRIKTARRVQRERCRGSRFNRSPACEKATSELNEAIVVAVRTGAQVPLPERIPDYEAPAEPTDS